MKNSLYDLYHTKTKAQSSYIVENNFTYRHLLGVIKQYLKKDSKILDIGCGAGTLALFLAGQGNSVKGVDLSKRAIQACKKSAKSLGLNNVSFEKINFPEENISGRFDFIILSEVLEHLPKDSLALKKIYSILNKDGILLLSTPSKNAPLYRLGLADKHDKQVGHLRRYTIEELVEMLEKQKFKIVMKKKNEGILRNFLFINRYAGKLVRFVKFFISDVVTFFDQILLRLFGESDIIIVAKKQ